MYAGLMCVLFPPHAVLGTRAHIVAVNKHLQYQLIKPLYLQAQPDKLCARLILLMSLCLVCFSFIRMFACATDERDSNMGALLK